MNNHSSGLYNTSEIFTDMVMLCRNDHTAFDEILIQAKGECVMRVDVQEKFYEWLSARVSPAKLSEYYIVCKDIESFCMSKCILNEPLFETTNIDIIQGVIDNIKSNRMLRFKNFRQFEKMCKVMDYYMMFLREVLLQHEKKSEGTIKNGHFSEEYIVPQNRISADIGSKQMPVQRGIIASGSEDTMENKDGSGNTDIWNFANNNLDFSNKVPVTVSYFGNEVKVQGWTDAFVKIICFMQEDYPSVIRGMVGYRFSKIEKVVLSDITGLEKFRKAAKVNDGIYLETECSSDEIITIVRILMDKCNMDYDNIEISYEMFKDTGDDAEGQNENKQDAIIVTDIFSKEVTNEHYTEKFTDTDDSKTAIGLVEERENEFEKWLITVAGFTVRSAQSYVSAITVAGQYSRRLGFSERELFLIQDAYQVYDISMKLLTNFEFAQMNNNQHNRYRNALLKYWDYCGDISCGININTQSDRISEQEDEVKQNRIDFIEWAQSQRRQKAAILAYLFDIKKCSEFAQKNDYIKEDILLIKNAEVLEYVFLEMRKDSKFVELNNERHKRLAFVMNKLIAFRRATAKDGEMEATASVTIAPVEKPIRSPADSILSVSPQVKERYAVILAENFVDGFRSTKAIDRNRFRMYYNDMFGEELTENDEQLIHTLKTVGTLRDERIFVRDETEQSNLIEEINETILDTFKAGASCIYLKCLFAKFQEQLADVLHVYNVDSLESILFSSPKRNYFKRHNYLFEYNKEPAPDEDVAEHMKNSNLPVTYSEMENSLWYIPLDKIKKTLGVTPGIVKVASEAYLYAPNLPVNDREIQQIADLISHALLQQSYISDVELMQLIENHCPSVIMNTSNYPIWGLRNALAYLLREKFSFRGAIISAKDEEISMVEVFSDFCRRSEHITVDELKQFAKELKTVIYWDSVYSEMVRVNQNEFVRRDKIHFDVEQTDSVLDNLISKTYAPIKTINLFLHFPTINVPWNKFVLESYVGSYSKKFRLFHSNYTATDCCGAIVRQDSDITDYRTLIVDVLANNASWKNKKDALQLLVDLGYQQRRSYSDIESVMQEAMTRMQATKK